MNEREITESRIPDPRKYRVGEAAGGVGSVGEEIRYSISEVLILSWVLGIPSRNNE